MTVKRSQKEDIEDLGMEMIRLLLSAPILICWVDSASDCQAAAAACVREWLEIILSIKCLTLRLWSHGGGNNVTICIEGRGERSPITICSLPLCECGAGGLGEACSIDIT